MRKRINRVFSTVVVLMLLLLCTSCGQNNKNIMVTEVYDHVLDAGTYTSLDYDFANDFFASRNDNWGGMCTAVAKVTDDGEMLVGRNMDLIISNKAAYIMRTKVDGCYETIGLTYTFRDYSPDYEDALKEGIPEEFSKVLPFISEDVLNSEGLYIEVNMRTDECWPTGEPKFVCSGTNPESDTRVYMLLIPRYIGEHCATVDEALEYVKNLDVYTMDGNDNAWNFCFMMADATGHYGLLEFAQNKIIWHEGQQAQTNFYIDEDMAAIEEFKCGVGRYETVMGGIDAVQSEKEMFQLMNKVTYYQCYFPEICQYDLRSEFVAEYPNWTYDYVMAKENQDEVMEEVNKAGKYMSSLTRQEQQNAKEYWESSFTEVINCSEKTLLVRFFEDDTRTITLNFGS